MSFCGAARTCAPGTGAARSRSTTRRTGSRIRSLEPGGSVRDGRAPDPRRRRSELGGHERRRAPAPRGADPLDRGGPRAARKWRGCAREEQARLDAASPRCSRHGARRRGCPGGARGTSGDHPPAPPLRRPADAQGRRGQDGQAVRRAPSGSTCSSRVAGHGGSSSSFEEPSILVP